MIQLPKRIAVHGEGIVDTEIFIMMQTPEINKALMKKKMPILSEKEVREHLARVYTKDFSESSHPAFQYLNAIVIDRYQE